MLEKWGKQAKMRRSIEKRRATKVLQKRIEAVEPLMVSYGPFFKLETEFVMTFFLIDERSRYGANV